MLLALPSGTLILLSASGTPKLLSNTQMKATYGESCFSGCVNETFIALILQNLPHRRWLYYRFRLLNSIRAPERNREEAAGLPWFASFPDEALIFQIRRCLYPSMPCFLPRLFALCSLLPKRNLYKSRNTCKRSHDRGSSAKTVLNNPVDSQRSD